VDDDEVVVFVYVWEPPPVLPVSDMWSVAVPAPDCVPELELDDCCTPVADTMMLSIDSLEVPEKVKASFESELAERESETPPDPSLPVADAPPWYCCAPVTCDDRERLTAEELPAPVESCPEAAADEVCEYGVCPR